MKKKLFCAALLALSLTFCACANSSKSGNVNDVSADDSESLGISYDADDIDSFEYDDDYVEEEIEHDGPYVPESYEGISYNSVLTSLGNYKGLSYSYESSHTVTAEELQEEIDSYLEMYELTSLTEDAAVEMGYESVENMKQEITKELESSYLSDAYSTAATDLLNEIIRTSTFKLDEDEINQVYEEQLAGYEELASYFGVSFDELCTDFFDESVDDVKAEVLEDAENSIKISLLVNAIIKDAGINVEELWPTKSAELLADYGYEDAWEYIDYYADGEYLMDEVRYKILVDYLFENNTNTAK